jgi:hypothetical protein
MRERAGIGPVSGTAVLFTLNLRKLAVSIQRVLYFSRAGVRLLGLYEINCLEKCTFNV